MPNTIELESVNIVSACVLNFQQENICIIILYPKEIVCCVTENIIAARIFIFVMQYYIYKNPAFIRNTGVKYRGQQPLFHLKKFHNPLLFVVEL